MEIKLFSSRVKYITEDATSVCTWYLKYHTHVIIVDEFRMPETPSVDLRHDYHASRTHRDMSHDIEERDQIPHPHGDQIPHPREG